MRTIRENLTYVFCAGLGILSFLLWAIPYVENFEEIKLGEIGNSVASGVNGYGILDLWTKGFGGVMSSILQILIVLLAVAMIAYGVCGLLKAFKLFTAFPDTVGKYEMKKLGDLALFVYAGLQVLLLIFLIVLCQMNTQKESSPEQDYVMAEGIRLHAGVFIAILFSVAAFVGRRVLEKKFPADAPIVKYVCSSCGKRARAKDNFCNVCGGKIVRVVEEVKVASPSEDGAKPAEQAAAAASVQPESSDSDQTTEK